MLTIGIWNVLCIETIFYLVFGVPGLPTKAHVAHNVLEKYYKYILSTTHRYSVRVPMGKFRLFKCSEIDTQLPAAPPRDVGPGFPPPLPPPGLKPTSQGWSRLLGLGRLVVVGGYPSYRADSFQNFGVCL